MALAARGIKTSDIVTDAAVRNAMVLHAAFGGSTNLLLHLPAIAHSAGLRRPTIDEWTDINRRVPRLVNVLPNGPKNHPTLYAYLAGGVPEVMLRLRAMGLLDLGVLTVSGRTLGEVLAWWETSPRRGALRNRLRDREGIDPEEVIFTPGRAEGTGGHKHRVLPARQPRARGRGDQEYGDRPRASSMPRGVYRKTGPARVFCREREAVAAIKGQGDRRVEPGDVLVLMGRGPLGSGMEEIYQITSALRYLSWGREVAVVTDARFSGVSTGACIGHVGPEALAGGPLGKVRDGDRIRMVIDCRRLAGTVDLVGDAEREFSAEQAASVLAARGPHPDLSPDPLLPDETRLWAALQQVGGGTWGGCVFER